MDLTLIAALNNKIDGLDFDSGGALSHLRSVTFHIDAAFKHLLRGQKAHDGSAFIDAVYRANCAFDECTSVAYRALAGKNPAAAQRAEIERYLAGHKLFHSRLLRLFLDYRHQWRKRCDRNAMAHFGESDAFIAVTSVSSFAFLLVDQLNEYRSYRNSQLEGRSCREAQPFALVKRADLLSRASDVVEQFCHRRLHIPGLCDGYSERRLIAALCGFIPAIAPDLSIMHQGNLAPNGQYSAALIIVREGEKILLTLKQRATDEHSAAQRVQAERMMSAKAIRHAILLCIAPHGGGYRVEERKIDRLRGRLRIVSP